MSDRIERLRGDGEVAGQGELQVNTVGAREKLQKYRLPDPYLYVLQFVRAASAMGATFVAFTFRPMTVECVFDAVFLPRTFRNVWEVAFGERKLDEHDAARYLAMGIGAMQAFKPARIEVASSTERWVIEDGEEWFDEDPFARRGHTRITLHERFRYGRLVDFATRLGGEAREVAILRRDCEFSSLNVYVDSTRIDRAPKMAFETEARVGTNEATIGLDVPPPIATKREEVEARSKGAGRAASRSALRSYGTSASGTIASAVDRPWRPLAKRGMPPIVRVLKHDVELEDASWRLPRHGPVGAGWVDARDVELDLSGRAPVRNERYTGVVEHVAFAAYHRALLRWLPQSQAAVRRELMRVVARWAKSWAHGDLPRSTRMLLETLSEEALWTHAGRQTEKHPGARVSMTEVIKDGALSYSDERFEDVELPSHELILFRSPGLEHGVLEAIAEVFDLELVDRAEDFETRIFRERAVQRWRARPERVDPSVPFQAKSLVGRCRVVVYLPIDDAGRRQSRSRLGVFVSGRLLRSTVWPLGFSVDVDGPLDTNEKFTDVLLGEEGPAVVHRIVELADGLHREFVEERRGGELHDTEAEILRRAILRPDPSSLVAKRLGVAGDFGATASVPEYLRDVACFELYGRSLPVSWSDLMEFDRVDILERTGDWHEYGRSTVVGGVNVVLAEPGELDAYRAVLGREVANARESVRDVAAEQAFLQNRRFRKPSANVRVSRTISVTGGEADVELIPADEPAMDVWILYYGRLLARRRWAASTARFRVFVESSALRPTPDFDDVVDSPVLAEVRDQVMAATGRLLEDWVAEPGALRDRRARRLWFDLARTQGRRELGEHEAVFPLVVDGRVVPSTQADVRRQVRDNGGVLFLAERREQVRAGVPTLLLGEGMSGDDARTFFADAQIAFAITDEERRRARRAFVRQPAVELTVPDALIERRFRGAGFVGHVGWIATDDAGIWIDAVVEERVLETIRRPAPAGGFRVRLTGSPIVPDPSWSFVLEGRQALEEVANRFVGDLVRYACARFGSAGHPDSLEPLVDSMIELYDVCRTRRPGPPFDLQSELRACPMIRTSDGTNTSLEELSRHHGEIPYTDDPGLGDPGVLLAGEARLERLKSVLSRPFVEATTTSERLDVLPLARVAGLLRTVRQERLDLLGDDLLTSIRWSEHAGPHLCAVDANGIRIASDSDLIQKLRAADRIEMGFLTSMVMTEVNRFYRTFTDTDERTLQRRLLVDAQAGAQDE